jgi:replicative DNA helicase Mcm
MLEQKRAEFVSKIKEFLSSGREKNKNYRELVRASQHNEPTKIDFGSLDRFSPALAEMLLSQPEQWFEIANEALSQIDLPGQTRLAFDNLPSIVNIRDLRAEHIGRFIATEGIVRRASEIRPEVIETVWTCDDCGEQIKVARSGNWVPRPFQCGCGCKRLKETEKRLIDTRWIVIEEPFELTEGERSSQVTVWLKGDLVAPHMRSLTDPGNRLRIVGILKDVPKGKFGIKLDFYIDANYVQPTEIGYQKIEISKEDEEKIKNLAKDPQIYDILVSSLAPSLYGLNEIKEAIILQMFGGVPRTLPDGTKFRGNIHILLIGDPASGKSQLLKLVPTIVPRGKYVSGKGVTTAGLTATVTKDEQFMGGWVVEAGAIVLANKGLLSIDEFEKMAPDDQIAMHEALEQGSVSIAKASIVTTLPAQTSVLAGGNPKFGRFDSYLPTAKQVTIPDTLLSRFDLKFVLKDIPDPEEDDRLVEHILKARDEKVETIPILSPDFIRKYIAYAREHCKPQHTKETGKILKQFYVNMRKKVHATGSPIPITLRQFEAMLRLAEASAKVQLSDVVRKEDAQRAIKLMKFSLKQLGYDPETGLIDIDRTEATITSKDRSEIRIVLAIIDNLSKKKKEISVKEIIEEAEKQGVERAEEIIEKMKREGTLFEPSPGFVQKI